ncbi:MAG: haloacid dehalogenase, partial [Planctomycetota bacterium]
AKIVDLLKQRYINSEQDIKTVGLGSSKENLAILETVDIPVFVPASSEVASDYDGKNQQVASNPGILGWAESIKQICQQHL